MFADRLIDEGGDWDRRNRLKVYRGTYCMAVRDFKMAASLFLDTVATFTSYELMDYKTFVTYAVFCSMIALSRPDLREKVENSVCSTGLNISAFLKDCTGIPDWVQGELSCPCQIRKHGSIIPPPLSPQRDLSADG